MIPTTYSEAQKALKKAKCEPCGGLGETNDADLGDMYYRTFKCSACNGTGLKPGTIIEIKTTD